MKVVKKAPDKLEKGGKKDKIFLDVGTAQEEKVRDENNGKNQIENKVGNIERMVFFCCFHIF